MHSGACECWHTTTQPHSHTAVMWRVCGVMFFVGVRAVDVVVTVVNTLEHMSVDMCAHIVVA